MTTELPPVKPKDLTAINPAPAGLSSPADVVRAPIELPYDPAPDRENVRALIALLLLGTLVGVIGLAVVASIVIAAVCYAQGACTPDTTELKSIRSVIEMVLTPLIGLVGAVTGFYFGEKSGSSKPGG